MHHQFDIAPGLAQTVYEVADPAKPVEFPALNYAAAAKNSLSAICRIEEGRDDCCRHQISGFASNRGSGHVRLYRAESQALVEKPYTEALKKELEEIQKSIPHKELAIQWDVCHEVLFLEGWELETFVDRSKEGLLRRIVISEMRSPPTSISDSSVLRRPWAQAFVGATGSCPFGRVGERHSRSQWPPSSVNHMPVPRGRADEAYFAPLKKLNCSRDRSILGLFISPMVSRGRARGLKLQTVSTPIRRWCECGFGRRNPETVIPLLDLHREVAAL